MIPKQLTDMSYTLGLVTVAVVSPQLEDITYLMSIGEDTMYASCITEDGMGKVFSGDFRLGMKTIHKAEMAIWSSGGKITHENALENAWNPAVDALAAVLIRPEVERT